MRPTWSNRKKNMDGLTSNVIILDTNVILYLGNKYLSDPLGSYVKTYSANTLYYSEISVAEVFAGVVKSHSISPVERLSDFQVLHLYQEVLMLSGYLSAIYSSHSPSFQHISLADKIIAATAVLNNAHILTADVNDFPRPYFYEVSEECIMYRKKDKQYMTVFQILKPNHELISQRMNELL